MLATQIRESTSRKGHLPISFLMTFKPELIIQNAQHDIQRQCFASFSRYIASSALRSNASNVSFSAGGRVATPTLTSSR